MSTKSRSHDSALIAGMLLGFGVVAIVGLSIQADSKSLEAFARIAGDMAKKVKKDLPDSTTATNS